MGSQLQIIIRTVLANYLAGVASAFISFYLLYLLSNLREYVNERL